MNVSQINSRIYSIIHVIINYQMLLSFPVSQCPPLNSLYSRNLSLTFKQPLQHLQQNLHPLIIDLKDKSLTKCYLIPAQDAIPKPKYDAVLLGGTFDYFHLGHQLLLLTAILAADKRILIGVSGDKLLAKKKNKQIMQPLSIRMEEIKKYIQKIKPHLILEIGQLQDPYGPAIHREDFDAIVVSIETKAGADKINQIRKQKNMKPLQVQICPLMSQTAKVDVKVSSSQTREYILGKNKMSVEQFTNYKQKWFNLNLQITQYFKQEHTVSYTQQWQDHIVQQYSQYWRFYHTNSHIYAMLQLFQQIMSQKHIFPELTQLQVFAIQIATWFHDVEYVPPAKDNEELSAELSTKYLKGLLKNSLQNPQAQELIKLVYDSIMQTKNHKPKEAVAKVLSDLDMSVLDSDREQYMEYAEGIRREYLPVAKDQYNKKRLEFLQSLSINEIFYYGEHTKIKGNIDWEINMLKSNKQQL